MSHNKAPAGRNWPGPPGRRDRLANAMAACCTYAPPGPTEDSGWWTLCPAHAEADAALRAVYWSIRDAVWNAPPAVMKARLAAAGVTDFNDLWLDVDAARRFADAVTLL